MERRLAPSFATDRTLELVSATRSSSPHASRREKDSRRCGLHRQRRERRYQPRNSIVSSTDSRLPNYVPRETKMPPDAQRRCAAIVPAVVAAASAAGACTRNKRSHAARSLSGWPCSIRVRTVSARRTSFVSMPLSKRRAANMANVSQTRHVKAARALQAAAASEPGAHAASEDEAAAGEAIDDPMLDDAGGPRHNGVPSPLLSCFASLLLFVGSPCQRVCRWTERTAAELP